MLAITAPKLFELARSGNRDVAVFVAPAEKRQFGDIVFVATSRITASLASTCRRTPMICSSVNRCCMDASMSKST